MPLGIPVERQVLQHQHRVARRDLRQYRLQARLQRVDQQLMAARSGDHLDLQAALAAGKVDLVLECTGRRQHATLVEHGGQRRRPALIGVLREEGYIGQLDAFRQALGLRR